MKFEHLIRESFARTCANLLPPLERTLVEVPAALPTESFSIAAVIGFTGDEIRGTLGIAASASGSARLLRAFVGAVGDAQDGDALGELANMTLGDLKRSWRRHGLSVCCSTPVIIRGLAVEVMGTGRSEWFQRGSCGEGNDFSVWVDIQTGPELALPDALEDESGANPSETILF